MKKLEESWKGVVEEIIKNLEKVNGKKTYHVGEVFSLEIKEAEKINAEIDKIVLETKSFSEATKKVLEKYKDDLRKVLLAMHTLGKLYVITRTPFGVFLPFFEMLEREEKGGEKE